MSTVLYILAEIIRNLAILSYPFMPSSSEKILNQLSLPSKDLAFTSFGSASPLEPGKEVPKPEGVFPRFVD